MSHIYFIDTDTGWLKIGQTRSLSNRVKQHRRKWPGMLLIAAIPCIDCESTEKEIFSHLESFDRDGTRELFKPGDGFVNRIIEALWCVEDFCFDTFLIQRNILRDMDKYKGESCC